MAKVLLLVDPGLGCRSLPVMRARIMAVPSARAAGVAPHPHRTSESTSVKTGGQNGPSAAVQASTPGSSGGVGGEDQTEGGSRPDFRWLAVNFGVRSDQQRR